MFWKNVISKESIYDDVCKTSQGKNLKLHISAWIFVCTFHMDQRVQAKQPHITALDNYTQSHQAVQQTQVTRTKLTSSLNLVPNS